MHEFEHARQVIETMIQSGDLPGLLRQAETLHGHLCPMLVLGVKAGQYAMTYLDRRNIGREEVVAIVETNNCFTDGIQMVTGCTFGNNALIFKDLGKTAVTVARRADGAAVRMVVRADYRQQLFTKYPAAGPLFEKVVVQRQATPEELHRFQHIWPAMSRRELEAPLEEQLLIQPLTIQLPPYAPIFDTLICSGCGEGVMATRVHLKEGQPYCLECAGEDFPRLSGQGIECLTKAKET